MITSHTFGVARLACLGHLPAVLMFALLLSARPAAAEAMQAVPAYVFVNSVGVATHFAWGTASYRTRFAEAKAALDELGIKHIREEIGNAASMPFFRDLNATLGVKLTGVINARRGSGANERLDPQDMAATLVRAHTLLGAQALAAIEGTNEFNILERDYAYPAWPQDLRDLQARMFAAVKADPALGHVPVLGPTLGGPNAGIYYAKLGDISPAIDFGTAHIYPNRQSFAQAVANYVAEARMAAPYGPLWVTETGWHNATGSGALFVDEDVQAKYVARAMVEFSVNPEIDKGFIYQLADPFPDPMRRVTGYQFGLLDNDLARKPKYYAVRNMMHILCDDRLPSPVGNLDIGLAGDLQDIRHALYQKANGVFYLVIWLEKQSMSLAGQPIANPAQPVSVTLPVDVGAVRLYLPSDPARDLTLGDRPVATFHAPSRLNLMVEDHVTILEIVPSGIPVPAVSPACNFAPS